MVSLRDTASAPLNVGGVILLGISSYCFGRMFRLDLAMLISIVLFAITLLLFRRIRTRAWRPAEIITMSCFSAALALSMVLSYHIVIGGNIASGSITENYITAYSWRDVVAFLLLMPSLITLTLGAYSFMKPHAGQTDRQARRRFSGKPVPFKPVFLTMALLFVGWSPYLLTYFPGFLFGDTFSSFAQIFGDVPWNDHYPPAYTAFIGICLGIGRALGLGNTGGCAIYAVIQMAILSFCLAYLCRWTVTRLDIDRRWATALAVLFALSPYVATSSIAFWKDPIFSAAVVLFSVLLFDAVLVRRSSRGRQAARFVGLGITALVMILVRSNGVALVVVVAVALFVYRISQGFRDRRNEQRHQARAAGVGAAGVMLAAVVVVGLVVTGPVYQSLGIASATSVEGLGVPLNQMARVAALDGDMSESDRDYLAEVLPLESYADIYAPLCVDRIKWSTEFNAEAFSEGVLGHWASLFVRNPKVYLDAWELQTFGFWSINQPRLYTQVYNINSGVPTATNETHRKSSANYDVHEANLLGDWARDVFPDEGDSIPVGIVGWTLVYLCLCCALCGRLRLAIALLPSLALIATLLVASPIWYWPRYGFAVQLLLPLYGVVACLLIRRPPRRRETSLVGSTGGRLHQ